MMTRMNEKNVETIQHSKELVANKAAFCAYRHEEPGRSNQELNGLPRAWKRTCRETQMAEVLQS
jgi:hypothetical protein